MGEPRNRVGSEISVSFSRKRIDFENSAIQYVSLRWRGDGGEAVTRAVDSTECRQSFLLSPQRKAGSA